MSKRIHEDNNNAKTFAKILSESSEVDIDMNLVQTNIVRFKLKKHSHADFIKACATEDIISILCLEVSGGFIRMVFHCDAAGELVTLGSEKLRKVLDSYNYCTYWINFTPPIHLIKGCYWCISNIWTYEYLKQKLWNRFIFWYKKNFLLGRSMGCSLRPCTNQHRIHKSDNHNFFQQLVHFATMLFHCICCHPPSFE